MLWDVLTGRHVDHAHETYMHQMQDVRRRANKLMCITDKIRDDEAAERALNKLERASTSIKEALRDKSDHGRH